jgi:hypothetical protein
MNGGANGPAADNKITWASVPTSIVLSIVVNAPFSNKSNVSYSDIRSYVVTIAI